MLDALKKTVREYLGTDRIPHLEEQMATAAQQISDLGTKVESIGNVAGDIAADFSAFRTAMEAQRGNLDADGQAALDDANAKADAAAAKLADLDVAVGDADGSDTPVVTEPTPDNPNV